MSFASLLSRCPIPFEPDHGAEVRAQFADLAPELRDLLEGTAGCSPFLKGLIQREDTWLRRALSLSPDVALNTVLTPLSDVPMAELGAKLRQAKRRVALLVALADLGGAWSLEQVTGALTRLADASVHLSLIALVAEQIRRGKLPGVGRDDAADGAGMVVLAMGKMGAGELNYSSDIDLICLFDETRFDPAEYQEVRAAFIRVTRKMTSTLADLTEEGYVFRTDLRLRPDAAVTPVCLSMGAAERYYESLGRTWERAAYIKARPCGGDIAAGNRFLETLTPFVWRKHLDFAAIQDAHDMRLRIREHKRLTGKLVLEGHNMKLGRGGIREIEFFTQTRQLIAGGRDSDLRVRETVRGLTRLARKGWIPPEVAQELKASYRAHREVEHRIQMINDAQTHDLPVGDEGIDRIARISGQGDTNAFRRELTDRLTRVHDLTEGFFSPGATRDRPELRPEQRVIVDRWRSYPALRSGRAVEIFKRVKPLVLRRLDRAPNPDEALHAFDGFLSGLPAGVQLFSLFEANPQLIDLIVDILATAPALGRHLARNSSVLDAVIGGDFFAAWPGLEALRADLSEVMSEVGDYERKLDAARRWAKEWHFRIGVHFLRGLVDAFEAAKQYADLAEAVVSAIWAPCCGEFARKHGPAPGRGAVVLGMGSLGAARLNAVSDLDLIVIYDPAGQDESDGPRPLSSRAYYARLTQALVTALSAPMAEGRLYEVDMRLRPSGRQGPVATSLDAFRSYQRDEAWTWEHLALTRARAVAGAPELAEEVEAFRRSILPEKGRGEQITADVAEMRARLRAAKPGAGLWDPKFGPGRLQDVELIAQTAALSAGNPSHRVEGQLRAGVKVGFLSSDEEKDLLAAYRLCWRVQACARLLNERALDIERLGEGGCAFLLRETGHETLDLLADALALRTLAAANVVEHLLPAADDAATAAGSSSVAQR